MACVRPSSCVAEPAIGVVTGARRPAVGVAEWRLPVSGSSAVALAAHLGVDCVQVDMGGPGRAPWLDAAGGIDEVCEAAERYEVAISAVTANHLNDLGIVSVDAPEAGQVRDLIERLLDAAHRLGAPLAFVPSFRRSAVTSQPAFLRTAEVLHWATGEAQARGLVLASENVLPPASARELADRVASSSFRLLLDTWNPVDAGLCPAELVRPLLDLLADQVHLKDGPTLNGATPALGSGHGHVGETLGVLRATGLPVHALILENDYRNSDPDLIRRDLRWARVRAEEIGEDSKKAMT